MAAENKNSRGREGEQRENSKRDKGLTLSKGAPRTTETGAQNNGGQTQRAGDTLKRQKHGGHR